MTCRRPDIVRKLEFLNKLNVVVPFATLMQKLAN